MTETSFPNVNEVTAASSQFHDPMQSLEKTHSRLAKSALFVAMPLAVLVIIASTTTGSRLFDQLSIGANAAEPAAAGEETDRQGNVLTAFLSRSPGERGKTDAIKGKAKGKGATGKSIADGDTPKQRALGKVFDTPVSKAAGPALSQPVLEFLPDSVISAADPLLALASPVLGGSSIFSPVVGGSIGGGGAFVGGSGGGGGGGGGGGDGAAIIPPPVATVAGAVPEPSTWILLLMGFAAIGVSIRRAKWSGPLLEERAGSCARS